METTKLLNPEAREVDATATADTFEHDEYEERALELLYVDDMEVTTLGEKVGEMVESDPRDERRNVEEALY